MLTSIQLTNFQSHKDTFIELDPGVNALHGLSDSGKTSILRAFNWVINNKPSGAEFQSHWGGDTEVTLTTDDGHSVTRRRTKSDNVYIMDGSEYRAFGQDVPTEIRDALNMSDVNIQGQMDKPFILSMSSGDVAQYLNKIVRLDVIDSSSSYVRKMQLDVNHEIKIEEAKLASSDDQLSKLGPLDDFELKLETLESYKNQLNKNSKNRFTFVAALDSINSFSEKISAANETLRYEKQINALISYQDELKAVAAKLSTLKSLRNSMTVHSNTIKATSTLVAEENALNAIYGVEKELTLIEKRHSDLDNILTKLQSCFKRVEYTKNQLVEAEKTLSDNMPDICPLCGSEAI